MQRTVAGLLLALSLACAPLPTLAQDVINPQTDASKLTTGALPAGRMPALTGDVTSPAGGVATTLAAGNAGNLNAGTLLAARMPALTGDCTTSAGAVATNCTKISGVDQTTAWTSYTPVPTCTGGVLTSAGAFKTLGKSVWFSIQLSPTSGTCSAAIVVALPTGTANRYVSAACREISNNNTIGVGLILSAGTTMSVLRYDGTAYAAVSGWNIVCSGIYEIQ